MNKKWFATYCVLVAIILMSAAFKSGYDYHKPITITETITETIQLPPIVTHEVQTVYVDKPTQRELWISYFHATGLHTWMIATSTMEIFGCPLGLWNMQNPDLQIHITTNPEDYNKLSDFTSLEELQTFLAQDDTDTSLILVADSSGKINFNGSCEDYAFQLRDRAADIGKRLEAELLTRSEYVKYYGDTGGLSVNDMHMVNKAVIGNDVFLIEPQDDKVWKVVSLD